MEITTTHLKRCALVTLKGRFDSNTAPDLEKALKALMDTGVHNLVLDMAEVEYFGSAAIRILVIAYKECRHLDRGDVRLARVNQRVHHVLELAGILPLVQSFDDPLLAVGSF
jgi:anti-sigma B factor antagonist